MNILAALKERIGILVWQPTPNCSEITRLASRSFEQPLPTHARWKIQLHRLICAWCHRYVKQLKFLPRASSNAFHKVNSCLAAVCQQQPDHELCCVSNSPKMKICKDSCAHPTNLHCQIRILAGYRWRLGVFC